MRVGIIATTHLVTSIFCRENVVTRVSGSTHR